MWSGESAGQLQPGAIVLGLFMDGEMAQIPLLLGVMRVNKSSSTRTTGRRIYYSYPEPGVVINNSSVILQKNTVNPIKINRQAVNNTVAYPGQTRLNLVAQDLKNIGIDFSGGNLIQSNRVNPSKPIPVANGIGGPEGLNINFLIYLKILPMLTV